MSFATNAFINALPSTDSLDIIGDVHGEWSALQRLLFYLGYKENGWHPQGRKLVFVGDLCDRGPDSPAVLDWVIEAVAAERAFAILGNHELNLLRHDVKDGSGWYFTQRTQDLARYAPWQFYPTNRKSQLHAALKQWPLVLQRDDLRVVHAAWFSESVQQLLNAGDVPLLDLYAQYEACFEERFQQSQWFDVFQQEKMTHAQNLYNEQFAIPFLSGTAHYDLLRSTINPIRALTNGIETLATKPFYINGRWRFTVRLPWWHQYYDGIAVVIGHYWRQWYPQAVAPHRRDLFNEPPTQWLGSEQQVFCIDFSIGARWRERCQGIKQSLLHLAALRWPEKQIMLDNGFCTVSTQIH